MSERYLDFGVFHHKHPAFLTAVVGRIDFAEAFGEIGQQVEVRVVEVAEGLSGAPAIDLAARRVVR